MSVDNLKHLISGDIDLVIYLSVKCKNLTQGVDEQGII